MNAIFNGIVIGRSGKKTIKVRVTRTFRHLLYNKFIRRFKDYLVHDEYNMYDKGMMVMFKKSAPYSKLKSWEVASSRKVAFLKF